MKNMKKSKTKTFERESEFSNLIEWVHNQIETVDKEVIQITPPDYDVRVELKEKYSITITKHL